MIDTELNAVGYGYNTINYTKEFQRVLSGIFACYTMMLKDKIVFPNDENEIRNKLLFGYLNNDNIRSNIGLDYLFNGEVLEPTGGKVDIKVQRQNRFAKSEAYYIIECKRLDNKNTTGISGLNADYINDGIYRFVSNYYSNYHRVNAMLGFVVEQLDISANIQNINALLKNPKIRNCNTTQEIRQATFIPDFEFHYSSEHNDTDGISFKLCHLMLDFSNNINESGKWKSRSRENKR
jgi:hypothetical protein